MKRSGFFSLITKPILYLLEYLFKITAGIVGIIVLGAGGSFLNKMSAGFGSIPGVLDQITRGQEKFTYISTLIRDYNTLTAAEFNQQYGGQALNRVMESLNGAVTYGQSVYQNLSDDPILTIIATLFAFLIFYIVGRACRFYRQKGQGSYLVKKRAETRPKGIQGS